MPLSKETKSKLIAFQLIQSCKRNIDDHSVFVLILLLIIVFALMDMATMPEGMF